MVLIVTADDFGLHPAINKGIIECVCSGSVTAVSLVAPGAAVAEALAFVREQPQLEKGIHLTLVGERPLTTGRLPKNYKHFLYEYLTGRLDWVAIRAELAAQFDFFCKQDVVLSHADSHQHLHLLPGISEIVVELCHANKITRVRTIHEPLVFSVRGLVLIVLRLLSWRLTRLCLKAGLQTTQEFYGFTTSMQITPELIYRAKQAAQNKSVEIMCHPGYDSEAYPDWHMDWDRERRTVLECLP